MTADKGKLGAWVAIFGAALGIVADELLLYSPNGGYEDPELSFMALISKERLFWGALLGVLAIPLEAGGLILVYRNLQKAGKGLALVAVGLGLYILALGTATHAIFFHAGTLAEMGAANVGLELLSPVAGAFVGGFFTLFALLAVMIGIGKTDFPKWLAFGTPVSVYLICMACYLAFPALGNYLMPAAFNLGMLVFCFLLILVEGKEQRA